MSIAIDPAAVCATREVPGRVIGPATTSLERDPEPAVLGHAAVVGIDDERGTARIASPRPEPVCRASSCSSPSRRSPSFEVACLAGPAELVWDSQVELVDPWTGLANRLPGAVKARKPLWS